MVYILWARVKRRKAKEYDGYLRESHNHQEVKAFREVKKQTEVEGIMNALNGQFIRPVQGVT